MKNDALSLRLAVTAAIAGLSLAACTGTRTGRLPMATNFGFDRDLAPISVWTLENANARVRVSDHGATLVSFETQDRDGNMADVILGFDSVTGYQSKDNQYFGCTTGRIANRIEGATFVVDGVRYDLDANDGRNQLHGGGTRSLDKVRWSLVGRGGDADGSWVEFGYKSPDGEEGYPGNVEFLVRYRLRPDGALEIRSRAATDRKTPIALTNHAYWNLDGAGAGTILGHRLRIPASEYTPTDDELIPSGDIALVAGTPLDFRVETKIGARIAELESTPARGYDHNYVIAGGGKTLIEVARLYSPASGRELVVESDQKGLQFYSGNWLHDQLGKDGRHYVKNGALCLEPQAFPNSVNEPNFDSILLHPDEEYTQTIVYRVGVRR
ncbi:MAG: galactose mutarotase [Planctomycetes bacterium]|nr:galactose mutarotase [Planctomycetota bacterium]MCB9917975.1 galactose mutarotase [Planctomycetota bacterium]